MTARDVYEQNYALFCHAFNTYVQNCYKKDKQKRDTQTKICCSCRRGILSFACAKPNKHLKNSKSYLVQAIFIQLKVPYMCILETRHKKVVETSQKPFVNFALFNLQMRGE